MTSQKDQIQALITDIDGVLQKTTPRLPWVVSGEMTQQRQVLERVRNYLVAFQRRQIAGEGFGQAAARPDLLAHDIYYQPAPYSSSPALQPGQQAYDQDELNAQQMLQAIVQEMSSLRSNLMQPLQADLDSLRQQRETLVHEIRQLEAQRQGYAGQPGQQQLIAEFLQALMSRLQETLPQQVAQTLRESNQQALPYANAYPVALAGSAPSVIATSDAPSQGLSNIQVSQAPADELVIRLDSTLGVVFEALQRNVQAYQESLSQGLEKMHGMGQQGEMMFTALISHLAQQLGRETSSYLQPPAPSSQESLRSSPSIAIPTSTPLPTQPLMPTVPSFDQPGAKGSSFTLPFPGTEIADQFASASAAPSTNVPTLVDTAIDSWLRASSASVTSDVDLEIAALNLEGFDLSQLADQDVNALLELDATLLETNLSPQPLLSPTVPIASPPAQATAPETSDAAMVEDTADIDAALKLLEQLSAELQPSSVADADAQIDRMLSSPTAPAGDTSTVGIPDDARDELDEFYESLFGSDAIEASIAPSQVDSETAASQLISESVEPEAAVVRSDSQLFDTQRLDSLLDSQPLIQPADSQPEAQPISTLPAEIQVPTDTTDIATTPPAAPSASTVIDPTLGWYLPTAPLVTQPVEPEIPEALLEDELLDGWDLADTEVDSEPMTVPTDDLVSGWELTPDDPSPLADAPLTSPSSSMSAPATAPTTDDLVHGWELTSDDRPLLPDASSFPTTDIPATDTLTAFFDDQDSVDASPVVPLEAAPATNQGETSQDEISSLNDLFGFGETDFGETVFGETDPTEGQPLVPAIADVSAPPARPNQPLDNTAVSPIERSPDIPPSQTPPVNLVEDYLADDRYTPASPDEDLLSLDEPVEALDSELWLDETTLNRLSEDLFNLEELISEPSTITEPATLSYGSAADSTPAPPDVTASESASSNETSLDDWSNAALGDFGANEPLHEALDDAATDEVITDAADTLPLESESRAIVSDPPDTFLLEGMDDLFANTPVAPPVAPILPPVPTAELPTSFTLEGMDDLFADSLASDRSLPATPTAPALPFTLEGVDDLFADAVMVSTGLPADPPPAEPPSFTLQGVDDLFADAPVASTGPLADPTAPALPFTLEGADDLFADAPVISTGLPADPPSVEPSLPFTLEGVDDLFADTPPMATTSLVPDAPDVPADPAAPEAAPSRAPIQPAPTQPDQVGEWGVRSGEWGQTQPEALTQPDQVTAFTLEQVGDLFIEVPSESTLDESPVTPTAPMEPSVLPPPPFTLEQVGSVETLSEAAPPAPSDLPLPSPPVATSELTSEPSALEQAFASLMGLFDEPLDEPPSVADTTDSTTQAPEKKKEMN